jgi:hypothetical protein
MRKLLSETVLGFAAAGRRLPGRDGKHVHPATLTRWALNGVRGASGETIRLEAVRVGGRWVTSAEALERFAKRLTAGPSCEHEPAVHHNADQERQLDRILGPLPTAA